MQNTCGSGSHNIGILIGDMLLKEPDWYLLYQNGGQGAGQQ